MLESFYPEYWLQLNDKGATTFIAPSNSPPSPGGYLGMYRDDAMDTPPNQGRQDTVTEEDDDDALDVVANAVHSLPKTGRRMPLRLKRRVGSEPRERSSELDDHTTHTFNNITAKAVPVVNDCAGKVEPRTVSLDAPVTSISDGHAKTSNIDAVKLSNQPTPRIKGWEPACISRMNASGADLPTAQSTSCSTWSHRSHLTASPSIGQLPFRTPYWDGDCSIDKLISSHEVAKTTTDRAVQTCDVPLDGDRTIVVNAQPNGGRLIIEIKGEGQRDINVTAGCFCNAHEKRDVPAVTSDQDDRRPSLIETDFRCPSSTCLYNNRHCCHQLHRIETLNRNHVGKTANSLYTHPDDVAVRTTECDRWQEMAHGGPVTDLPKDIYPASNQANDASCPWQNGCHPYCQQRQRIPKYVPLAECNLPTESASWRQQRYSQLVGGYDREDLSRLTVDHASTPRKSELPIMPPSPSQFFSLSHAAAAMAGEPMSLPNWFSNCVIPLTVDSNIQRADNIISRPYNRSNNYHGDSVIPFPPTPITLRSRRWPSGDPESLTQNHRTGELSPSLALGRHSDTKQRDCDIHVAMQHERRLHSCDIPRHGGSPNSNQPQIHSYPELSGNAIPSRFNSAGKWPLYQRSSRCLSNRMCGYSPRVRKYGLDHRLSFNEGPCEGRCIVRHHEYAPHVNDGLLCRGCRPMCNICQRKSPLVQSNRLEPSDTSQLSIYDIECPNSRGTLDGTHSEDHSKEEQHLVQRAPAEDEIHQRVEHDLESVKSLNTLASDHMEPSCAKEDPDPVTHTDSGEHDHSSEDMTVYDCHLDFRVVAAGGDLEEEPKKALDAIPSNTNESIKPQSSCTDGVRKVWFCPDTPDVFVYITENDGLGKAQHGAKKSRRRKDLQCILRSYLLCGTFDPVIPLKHTIDGKWKHNRNRGPKVHDSRKSQRSQTTSVPVSKSNTEGHAEVSKEHHPPDDEGTDEYAKTFGINCFSKCLSPMMKNQLPSSIPTHSRRNSETNGCRRPSQHSVM